MKQLVLGGAFGSLGLLLVLANGCGGSSFSASDAAGAGAGAEAVAGDAAGGATDAAGAGSTGGTTSSGGKGGTTSSGGKGGTTSSGGKGGGLGGTTSGGGGSGSGGIGGGTSSGGMSGGGAAGAISSGGGGAGGGSSCAGGTVTFKMVPNKSSGGTFCTSCGANWLTITNASAKAVLFERSCNVADCSTCASTACPPIACLNQIVPDGGLTRDWDATQWVGSTCGAGAMACASAHCVPPGKYRAKMCGYKNTTPDGNFCTPNDTPSCVEVDFQLPGATTVQGTIGG